MNAERRGKGINVSGRREKEKKKVLSISSPVLRKGKKRNTLTRKGRPSLP